MDLTSAAAARIISNREAQPSNGPFAIGSNIMLREQSRASQGGHRCPPLGCLATQSDISATIPL